MDGCSDILISNGIGEIYLYFGGNPMDTIPDMIFTEPHDDYYGGLPAECKDLNGDGFPDFCISADCGGQFNPKVYVYFGGPFLDNQADLVLAPDTMNTSAFTCFGRYMSMGDFNGDGFNDLAISAGDYELVDWVIGKLFVYYGGPNMDSIPDYTITADANEINSFSLFVSLNGDVNNDGYDDIVCKGWRGPYPPVYGGRIGFWGGSEPDTIADWEFRQFGGYPFYIGAGSFIIPDVNDDGFDDIVVGCMNYTGAYIFYGGANVDTLWDVRLRGYSGHTQNGCNYAGDVNADGWGDVMVKSGEYNSIICVYFLEPGMGGYKEDDFWFQIWGYHVISQGYAGDVNGDGIDDLMFAIWFYEYYKGEVFIYSDTTLSSVRGYYIELSLPDFTLNQNYPNPFNSFTVILFEIMREGEVSLKIYDCLGREVW